MKMKNQSKPNIGESSINVTRDVLEMLLHLTSIKMREVAFTAQKNFTFV